MPQSSPQNALSVAVDAQQQLHQHGRAVSALRRGTAAKLMPMTVDDAPMMPEVRHYKIAGGSYRANSPLYAMQRGGVGTAHYDSLGAGYCRDEGMHRPDGYYIPLAELSVRERYTTLPRTSAAGPSDLACAEHCSDDSNCLGYAIDRDTCTIYTRT